MKRDQRDFALWKAAETGRTLAWPSPWGKGFPGWHIECSAMAAAFLGREIDFHTGGVDNIFPHHEDEIAQSEAAFAQRHVRYWMHGQHLLVDGLKMAKSTGNVYTLSDIERRGFEPLAFRYLCAQAHYRARLNFTWSALRSAQRGLDRLRGALSESDRRTSRNGKAEAERLRAAFWQAAADDLNLPRATAVAWRAALCDISGELKQELIADFDRLLGLQLTAPATETEVPESVRERVAERQTLRRRKRYREADPIRAELIEAGYEVRDTRAGTQVRPQPAWRRHEAGLSSSEDVESLIAREPELEISVGIVARRGCPQLMRCLESVRRFLPERAEIIVVDNGFDDDCRSEIDEFGSKAPRARAFHADHFLGTAAGRNVSLRQARGRVLVLIDTSVEMTGDALTPLARTLDDHTIGIAGRWGVTTGDLRSFEEAIESGNVDAVEGYIMAFRRDVVREAGLLDEKYRFYRHLDLDFSFAVRNRGYRAVIDTNLPLIKHEHVDWNATPPQERDALSKRNFYRFLRKWGKRSDLVLAGR
ncbi:MAG: glycosyltransferase [Chloroflexi bacterium]|nr:MAG: glycosyltransferase [Chloroflexota bacterium]